MSRLTIESDRIQQHMDGLYRDVSRRISASPPGTCPVDMSLSFLRMSHAQTCGKCTPCRVGLGRLAEMIEDVLEGEADLSIIDKISETAKSIAATADCAIGFETARVILLGITGFHDDYVEHITKGRCICGQKQPVPCVAQCPAHVDIPGYIALVKAGRNGDAVKLIRRDNPFPSVCAYVCEHPCEERCRRSMMDDAVNICGIKRYAVDHAEKADIPICAEKSGKKIAVAGGGPGGLTAAYYLTLMGHTVTVYEQRHKPGGMLRYGIPDYRLPQEVLDRDIKHILDTGVRMVLDTSVGKDITVEELKKEYDAVYLSVGAHGDRKLGIEGEDADNLVSAVEMLRRIGEGEKMDLHGKNVVVVGGGNVAMDATRTSLRLGAKHVTCVYRRRIDDMTALMEEIEEAQSEGVEIMPLHAPARIEKDKKGKATALWAKPQIISRIGSDGRPTIRNSGEEEVRIPADHIIVAIGQQSELRPFEDNGISTHRGRIKAENSSYVEGSGNVFAGGDAVSGPATVILAVAAGKVAAANIDEFLGFNHKISVDVDIPLPQLTNSPACGRVNIKAGHISEIEGNFDLVSIGMTDEECAQECSRCLRCDHFGYGGFRGGRLAEW